MGYRKEIQDIRDDLDLVRREAERYGDDGYSDEHRVIDHAGYLKLESIDGNLEDILTEIEVLEELSQHDDIDHVNYKPTAPSGSSIKVSRYQNMPDSVGTVLDEHGCKFTEAKANQVYFVECDG